MSCIAIQKYDIVSSERLIRKNGKHMHMHVIKCFIVGKHNQIYIDKLIIFARLLCLMKELGLSLFGVLIELNYMSYLMEQRLHEWLVIYQV